MPRDLAAMWSAVSASSQRVQRSGSAPRSRSARATLRSPRRAASWSGVNHPTCASSPSRPCAPPSSSATAAAVLNRRTATYSGVWPTVLRTEGSAPAASRAATQCASPRSQARCSGAHPCCRAFSSGTRTSAGGVGVGPPAAAAAAAAAAADDDDDDDDDDDADDDAAAAPAAPGTGMLEAR
jgi:hypothetical protein